MSTQRSVVSSAKLIAVCTLVSRVAGLARDILLARAFGLAWVQDAWVYAFQVPNLFRRLFGEGALAAAFVPTFSRTLEEDGRPAAWRLLARTLALLTVTVCTVIVALALIIAVIWHVVPVPTEAAAERRLLLALTAIMLPFMLTICVVALFSSILNCLGSFVPAALMSVLLNVCMIIGIGWLAPALYPGQDAAQAFVVAWTVVAAGVLQVLVMLPVLRATGVRLGWRLDTRDPAVRRMLRLVLPVLLGQGVLAFGVFLDAQICILLTQTADTTAAAATSPAAAPWYRPLHEGALGAVTYAQRLYQFPLGVLVISLATAALPAFSRLAARQDWPAWTGEVRTAFRLALFEGLLAGTMMVVMPTPIVRLLFEYGDFTPTDTLRVARIVPLYGVGLWAFCAQHIVLRGFYSLGDVRTPLRISAVLLVFGTALNLALVWFAPIREAAFAISTSASAALSVAIGLSILQRRAAMPIFDRGLPLVLARMLLAAAATGGAVRAAWPLWLQLIAGVAPGIMHRALETFGLLALGIAVFLAAARLLRLREVGLLLARRPAAERR